MTTAQVGLAVSAPQAFREKMFSLVGDRNPLDVLALTDRTLADILGKHSSTALRSRPTRSSAILPTANGSMRIALD
jgi:hypothetical protein